MDKHAAFSLLELLVILVVLAFLIVLAFPIFNLGSDLSRQLRCASQLRGIGAAMAGYAVDHNGLVVYNVLAGESGTWEDGLLPYLLPGAKMVKGARPPGVFACPSGTTLVQSNHKSDYGKNLYINEKPEKVYRIVYRLVAVQPSSEVIFAGDAVARGIASPSLYEDGNLAARHRGKANLLYFDGHVVAVSPAELPGVTGALPWVPQ
ncbi:MAG TPA: hypothetical protein VNQ90_17510 [Chthoniobacteraceae bacterium]|nr:hypothetical protein [Chthoniobacteraceae bacterium]